MEAETGGTQLQAKDLLAPPEAGKMPPWSLRMKQVSTGMLILMTAFQNCERINRCCFRPRCLKYFVLAAPGH